MNNFNPIINFQCHPSEAPYEGAEEATQGIIETLSTSAWALLPYVAVCAKAASYVFKLNTLKNAVTNIAKRFSTEPKKEETEVKPRSKKEIRKLVKNRKSKETKASLMKKTMVGLGKDAINLGVASMDVANLVSPSETMKGIVLAKKAVDNLQKSKKLISGKAKPTLEISENLLKAGGNAGKVISLAIDSPSEVKLIAQGSKMVGSSLGLARNFIQSKPKPTQKIVGIGTNGFLAVNDSWEFQKALKKIDKLA